MLCFFVNKQNLKTCQKISLFFWKWLEINEKEIRVLWIRNRLERSALSLTRQPSLLFALTAQPSCSRESQKTEPTRNASTRAPLTGTARAAPSSCGRTWKCLRPRSKNGRKRWRRTCPFYQLSRTSRRRTTRRTSSSSTVTRAPSWWMSKTSRAIIPSTRCLSNCRKVIWPVQPSKHSSELF